MRLAPKKVFSLSFYSPFYKWFISKVFVVRKWQEDNLSQRNTFRVYIVEKAMLLDPVWEVVAHSLVLNAFFFHRLIVSGNTLSTSALFLSRDPCMRLAVKRETLKKSGLIFNSACVIVRAIQRFTHNSN